MKSAELPILEPDLAHLLADDAPYAAELGGGMNVLGGCLWAMRARGLAGEFQYSDRALN